MPSYVSIRDLSAVISAGNALAAAGGKLWSNVDPGATALGGREVQVLGSRDVYGEPFWTGTYAKDGRNSTIYARARELSIQAEGMGKNVVKSANEIIWMDALAGAAMFPSSLNV